MSSVIHRVVFIVGLRRFVARSLQRRGFLAIGALRARQERRRAMLFAEMRRACVLALCAGSLWACSADVPEPGPPAPWPRVFPQSEFYQPIGDNPTLDPDSASYIADLRGAKSGGRLNLNLTSYNVPVYVVPAGTAQQPLHVDQPTRQTPATIPIPPWARPAPGDDGHLALLDLGAGQGYELWQARVGGEPSATVAIALPLEGDGVNKAATGVRATGLSLLLGLITYDEVRGGGPISHALAWVFDKPSRQFFVPPAVSSDGKVSGGRSGSIPAGSRVQLDPTLDLGTLGLSPAGRRLAEAMQRYGLICVDSSSDSSVVAEQLHGGLSWSGLLTEDALYRVPIDRLRVLKPIRKVAIP